MEGYTESAFRRALKVLERMGDRELLEAYRQFTERVEAALTSDEQHVYAAFQQRTTGGVQPEEQAVADKLAAADPEALQIYERYLALLTSHQAPARTAS